jgi:hypothetical protein
MAIDEPKGYLSAIAGLILIALGIIPLLNHFGVIGWNFPAGIIGVLFSIMFYIAAAAGLWLIIDGFMEDDTIRMVTVLLGIVIMIAALIPLLNSFKVIPFGLPFLTPTIVQGVFVVEGLFLLIAAFAMF